MQKSTCTNRIVVVLPYKPQTAAKVVYDIVVIHLSRCNSKLRYSYCNSKKLKV